MTSIDKTCQLKATVNLEVDKQLVLMAERLNINLSDLLEEALTIQLSGSGQLKSVSVSDITLNMMYNHLIEHYPVKHQGLRNSFTDQPLA
jgi:hypothetical protein